MNRFDWLDGSEVLILKYIFKLGGTEMEAVCFDEIAQNIGRYTRNSRLLNGEICEKFRRTSILSVRKIILL